jgi:hypothetical protein
MSDYDTLFRIGELGVFAISAGGILIRLGAMTTRFELIGKQQAKEIAELKDAVKEMQSVVITQAVQTDRQNTFDSRILAQGQRLDAVQDIVNDLSRILARDHSSGK